MLPPQAEIDELVQEAKADVQKAIKDSGKSQTIWVMSKEGTQMLGEWGVLQATVKEAGVELPDLLDNVTVTVS